MELWEILLWSGLIVGLIIAGFIVFYQFNEDDEEEEQIFEVDIKVSFRPQSLQKMAIVNYLIVEFHIPMKQMRS